MDAYIASLAAISSLSETVRTRVALPVMQRWALQVQKNLDAMSDPDLPARALQERKDAMCRLYESAVRLDPLSGEIMRNKVLAAADAIDRRFYTRILQSLPEVLEEPSTLEYVQGALFWAIQYGSLKDLQLLASRLPDGLPKPLQALKDNVGARLHELTEEAEGRPEPISVRAIAPIEEPVRFVASNPAGRPLDREVAEEMRRKLSELMVGGAVAPQELAGKEGVGVDTFFLRSDTARILQGTFDGVLLEPDVKVFLQGEPLRRRVLQLRVVDRSGQGIPQVLVGLTLEQEKTGVTREVQKVSDGSGRIVYPLRNENLVAAEIRPRGKYWSKRYIASLDLDLGREILIGVDSLPDPTPSLCWWRRHVGFQGRGEGIRIALIDSGVAPHPALKPTGGMCVKSLGHERWDRDELGHGTHVAGILCGRDDASGFQGVAPDAELWVFRACSGTGSIWGTDVIEAIRQAVQDYGVDIINISAGAADKLVALEAEIQQAAEAGVVVVAAAGNQGRQEVCYPARFEDAVGVSACGRRGSYPPDSIHAKFESQPQDGKLYIAGFSNYGSGIDVCAPGVAILSTVPDGLFGCNDGTSMACPMVAGAVACLLSEDKELYDLRGRDRVLALKARLRQKCRKMKGWTDLQQGAGLLHP